MRALKLTFLLSLLPTLVFAGNIDMSGNGEDCALTRALTAGLSGIPRALCAQAVERYKQGRQTQENVTTICRGTQNVAWYQDRDNTMSDANDEVGRAMAVVLGPNGTATQAVQVCPGVYLATAHGALDSPIIARENNRPVREAGSLGTRIIAYPMVPDNMMYTAKSENYISPRLRDPSLWEAGNQESDYVFIKVDSPVRPNSFVTPLDTSSGELVENRSLVDVNLYRGKSRYEGAETGAPIHSEEHAIPDTDTRALAKLYQSPQRVNSSCEISRVNTNSTAYVDHNCPTEQGVSGSTYASNINGRNYLLGLHTRGSSNNIDSSSSAGGSTMLTSSSFCSDYQTACGQPCPRFEDVVPQESQSVSL